MYRQRVFFIIYFLLFNFSGCALLDSIGLLPDDSLPVVELISNGELDPEEYSNMLGLPVVKAHKGNLNKIFLDSLAQGNAVFNKLELQLFPDEKFTANSVSFVENSVYKQIVGGGGLHSDYFMSLVLGCTSNCTVRLVDVA